MALVWQIQKFPLVTLPKEKDKIRDTFLSYIQKSSLHRDCAEVQFGEF